MRIICKSIIGVLIHMRKIYIEGSLFGLLGADLVPCIKSCKVDSLRSE